MPGAPWYKRMFGVSGKKSFAEPNFWQLDALRFPFLNPGQPDKERIENDFQGYVQGAFKSNGIVFAAMLARQLVFSEARFQWRQFNNGRPGNLFGSPELSLLENPWPGGTTGELLAHMEQDASLAGNCYLTIADDAGRLGKAATGPGRRIARLRPDWVQIIIDSASGNTYDADARVVGYLFEPRPYGSPVPNQSVVLLPDEVCHYSPIPDPTARFRGMSWLTPVIQEITADKAATTHKLKFFENGATPAMVIKFDKESSSEAFEEFVEKFASRHEGVDNAYRTLVLSPGADAVVVGKDLQQLDFKGTQGAGESRIAAAARVHPALLGLSEALQGSSLNAGNFAAAKRMFMDGTMRPLWRMAAASLQTLVTPPGPGVSLWYDDRDIAFLREDATDLANIQQTQSSTIRQLIDAGFEPATVIEAVRTNDWTKLTHTGLFSVQLQQPGTQLQAPSATLAIGSGSAANGQ